MAKRRMPFDEWKVWHDQRRANAEALAFDCAVCERRIVPEIHHISGQLSGRDRNVPPLCKQCEHGVGKVCGLNSSRRSIPQIYHGSFMDRRIASQIAALAEALDVEANRIIWSKQYAERPSRGA